MKMNQNDSCGPDCRISGATSDVISRRHGSHRNNVRIVIRPTKEGHGEALTLLIDCWLAEELASQVARDLLTTKNPHVGQRTRRRN